MATETLTFKIEDSEGNVVDSMQVDVTSAVTISVSSSGNSTQGMAMQDTEQAGSDDELKATIDAAWRRLTEGVR